MNFWVLPPNLGKQLPVPHKSSLRLSASNALWMAPVNVETWHSRTTRVRLQAMNACLRAMDDMGKATLNYLAGRFMDEAKGRDPQPPTPLASA